MTETLYPGPVITVEARYGVPATWFDMTCDVFGIRYRRGRQQGGPNSWRTNVQAGEMTLELDNSEGQYSGFSRDGDLMLGEGTTIRVRCEWEGVHHALFVGNVEQWKEDWSDSIDRVLVTAVDDMAALGEQGGAFDWVPGAQGQTVRARIEQLLNRAGVRGEPFYSHQGSIHCIAPKVNRRAVTDEITQSALSDFGVFFHEPTAIVNPADAGVHTSSWVYLDRSRFRSITAAPGAPVPTVPVATNAADWRNVAGPADRTVGVITRPAQTVVPTFTDACLQGGDDEIGYRDIDWSYVAYERPSLVAVSNAAPPEERDLAGNALPLPWAQQSTQVAVTSVRHKIIELTDLRYTTRDEGIQLASAIAVQLGQPKLEVTRLRLWPHYDPAVFDTLLALRLQDHVITVRNLVHGTSGLRIEIDSLVEGFDVALQPRPGWQGGDHVAEWDVSLLLSPVIADIEDVPILPPDVPPTPGVSLVLAAEGQSAGGGVGATGWISGGTLRLSYTNSDTPITPVYAEIENVLTLVRQRLDMSSRQATAPVTGATAIADLFPGTSLLAGTTYRVRVVTIDSPEARSNWVTIQWPMPTPAAPRLVDRTRWEQATYGVTPTPMTGTQTTIEWDTLPGVRYQIGIQVGHVGTAYAAEPVQASELYVGFFLSDTDYAVAVRYVSGGLTSPWSPPLKLRMGHQQRIDDSGFTILGQTPGIIEVGHGQNFACLVPVNAPPPEGIGDGQWTRNPMTFDPAFIGRPDGFVGALIDELRVYAYTFDPANDTAPFGTFLCIPSYAIVVAYVTYEVVWDQENNSIPTTVPNPTWTGDNAAQGYWRASFSLRITDKDALERNGVVGLRHIGYTSFIRPLRIRGWLQAWGHRYSAVARLSNKVIP